MFKYSKDSKEFIRFSQVFENQICKKTINYKQLGFIGGFVTILLLIFILIFNHTTANAGSFDVNWELSPHSMDCYVGQSESGYNKFRMSYSGTDPNSGAAISGNAIATCTKEGFCEPGRHDIQGYSGDNVYEGDSHGTCHCECLGYVIIDGRGYWKYRLWSDPPFWSYQSWVVEDEFIVPAYGGISISKGSTDSWTEKNYNYNFEGCVYYIYNNYNDALSEVNPVSQITLNSSGNGSSAMNLISEYTYYVRESSQNDKHGKNYFVNSEIASVKIEHDTKTKVSWSTGQKTYDVPACENALASIIKTDSQTKNPGVTEGSIESFEGAEYEFVYLDYHARDRRDFENHMDRWRATWVMTTDEHGMTGITDDYKNYKIGGNDFYTQNGHIIVPLGSVMIKETKAPEGYLQSSKSFIAELASDPSSSSGVLVTYYDGDSGTKLDTIVDPHTSKDALCHFEQVKKGDYKFFKINQDNEPLTGIPFKITSVTTGEWHIVVSDENGVIDTSNSHVAHSHNTNFNDILYDPTSGKIIDESKLNSDSGVWFAMDKETGTIGEPVDSYGALPLDTYTVEELLITKNEQYYPFSQRSFIVSNHGYNIDGGTWVNTANTCLTKARTIDDDNIIECADNQKVIDRVYYSGLLNESMYEVKACLVNKLTGDQIEIKEPASTDNYLHHKFLANPSVGYTDIEAIIDARKLAGEEIVWLVEIYDCKTMAKVAEHKDIIDADEYLIIDKPSLETDLCEDPSLEKVLDRNNKTKLVDFIVLKNLVVGQTYRLNGWLVNKENGEEYINEISQEPVKTELEFCAKDKSERLDIEYEFDSTLCPENSSYVSFIDLYLDEVKLAEHSSLDNERQTITLRTPKFETEAIVGDEKKEFILGDYDKVCDKLNYMDFPNNAEVDVYSWFVYADCGLPVVNNNGDIPKSKILLDYLVSALGGRVTKENRHLEDGTNSDVWQVQFGQPTNKIVSDKLNNINWEDFKDIMFNKQTVKITDRSGVFDINYDINIEEPLSNKIVAYTIIVIGDTVISSSTDINNNKESLIIHEKPKTPEPETNIKNASTQTGDLTIYAIIFAILCYITCSWVYYRKY